MTLPPPSDGRRPWSLRRRLVLGIGALLAVAIIVIGVVSVALLRGTLVDRLDEQLLAATQRSQGPGAPGGGLADGPGVIDGGAAIPRELITVGTITAVIADGSFYAGAYYDVSGEARTLSSAQQAALAGVPDDGRPYSASLGELGDYRLVSVPASAGVDRVIGLPLSTVNSIVRQLVLTIGIVAVLGVLGAVFAATVIIRRSLRPLDRVAATASRVAELPLDRGEVALAERVPDRDADARTEVGQVGAAINRMLGHVASALTARQESERKVRQFVADASHELRTPLASIRGYSELTRRSGHTLPPDVVHSIGRVESEAIRMTSLVEDLLLLARLDEGRDLERSVVDLSRLLIDTVGDAHAAGPDHEWSLELPDEPVLVVGDALRLHQVIVNLLANARVHTPPGTPVTVALAETDVAVVTVTDAGPGIPADLQPHLFERFARGDGSRSRAAGSTGLGLAIVDAVVAGHDGSVAVRSRPGDTVFTVTLPLAAEER